MTEYVFIPMSDYIAILDATRTKRGVTSRFKSHEVAPAILAIGGDSSSETPLPNVLQATPVITVSNSGLITAEAAQEAGAVAAGTKMSTYQLPVEGGKTVVPTTEPQTVVEAGTFVTGDIVVEAVSNDGEEEPAEDLSAELTEQETRIYTLGEKLGALAPTIVISFAGMMWGEYGEEYYARRLSGSYSINGGESVSFSDVTSIALPFVPLGATVRVSADSCTSWTGTSGCEVDFSYDEWAFTIIPTAEGASVTLYDSN